VSLPPSLRFGASTSAYQIEGATREDGRGASIWDGFGAGDTGETASGHYHRWREDVDLMAELGLEAYRFSIAWPRVQPDGRGALNRRGVEFYRRLAAALRERGIEPVATLYHSDLPQALQDRGGWAARDTIGRFADYAAHIARELGGEIAHWITHNEPWGVAFAGHALGEKAPGLRDFPTAVRIAHHLLVSHGLAVRALRGAGEIGIALNLAPVRAASPDEPELRRTDDHLNRRFLDPLLRGAYPDHLIPPEVGDGDLAAIAEPLDFLGINYYHPEWVGPGPPPPPVSSLGWPIAPDGLEELLARLRRDYVTPPLWITENGVPDARPDTGLDDPERIDYLRDHVDALGRAIAAGADVRRYFVWSLLDNFEWELGYSVRFGLVHVDHATGARTPKRSAHWYRELIARTAAARAGSG
jgi:beta-glucosidase